MPLEAPGEEVAGVRDRAGRILPAGALEEVPAAQETSSEPRALGALGKHSSEVARALQKCLWARTRLGLVNPTSTARISPAEVEKLLRDFYEIEIIDKEAYSGLVDLMKRRFANGEAVVVTAPTPEELEIRLRETYEGYPEGYKFHMRGGAGNLPAIAVRNSDPEVVEVVTARSMTEEGYVIPAYAGLIRYFMFD